MQCTQKPLREWVAKKLPFAGYSVVRQSTMSSLTLSGTSPDFALANASYGRGRLTEACLAEAPPRRGGGEPQTAKFAGGHRSRVTPVPIPNTEVKPATADGTAWETVWESRSLPALF